MKDVGAPSNGGNFAFFTAEGAELPKWLQELVAMENLEARAELMIAPSLTLVRGLEAKGGGLTVHAAYAKRLTREQGAALVEAGPLSVGLGIRDGKKEIVIKDTGPWFGARVPEIEGAHRGAKR